MENSDLIRSFHRLTGVIPRAQRELLRGDILMLQAALKISGDYVSDRRATELGTKVAEAFARKRENERSWELVGDRSGAFGEVTLAEAVVIMGVAETSLRVQTSAQRTFTKTRVLAPRGEPELVTCRRLPAESRYSLAEPPEDVKRLVDYLKAGGTQGRRF